MFGSTVLEVAFGLTFCYASVALIVSTLNEAIASACKLRARSLLSGIKTMLNDPRFDHLARAVYSHALVNPHDNVSALDQRNLANKPSYIEAQHFAIALVEGIQTVQGDFEQLGHDIAALNDLQLRQALEGIYRRSGGDAAAFRDGLANWFDAAMERVSGSYKRRSQLICVLLTLLLAVLFNIDSLHLFRTLWHHPTLAAQIGTIPVSIDQHALEAMWTLPIGWETFPPVYDSKFYMQVAGWLLTSSTAIFGAPFWFDLLQRIINLRGTGPKPGTANKPKDGAKDGAH